MGSEPVDDRFGLVGTTLEGRFRVESVIAEGGFGVVYRTTQVALDRRVALKVLKLPPRLDEAGKAAFVEKFASEAKTIARINHPSIVQVYDFGAATMPSGDIAPWMALEWLTGTTLEDELNARRGHGGRMPSECMALMLPVLEALAYAHREGVAHRDIKPANIMLASTPTGQMLKVLDFGIAKIMGEQEAPGTGMTRTASAMISFSPMHASPEQISHGRSGPWTDVHALGLLLCEMVTDQSAFTATELTTLYIQIMDKTRPTPRSKGIDVGAWEAVLARALAVSPNERFRDAGELLEALRSALPAASDPRISLAGARLTPNVMPSGLSAAQSAMAVSLSTNAPLSTDDPPVVPLHRGGASTLLAVGVIGLLVAGGLVLALRPAAQTGAEKPVAASSSLVDAPRTSAPSASASTTKLEPLESFAAVPAVLPSGAARAGKRPLVVPNVAPAVSVSSNPGSKTPAPPAVGGGIAPKWDK